MAFFEPAGVPLQMPSLNEIRLPDPRVVRKYGKDLQLDTAHALAIAPNITEDQYEPITVRLLQVLDREAGDEQQLWRNADGSIPGIVVSAVRLGIAYARVEERYSVKPGYSDPRIQAGMIMAAFNIPAETGIAWVGPFLIIGAHYLARTTHHP